MQKRDFVPCTQCDDPLDCGSWNECYKFGDPNSDPYKREQELIDWIGEGPIDEGDK